MIKKNTRVKINGLRGGKEVFNGKVGIVLEDSYYTYIAINGVNENYKVLYENNLTPVEPSIDTLCVGDVIIDKDGSQSKVLAMQGDVFLKSNWDNFNKANSWYTKEQAKECGWKVKGSEEIKDDATEEAMKLLRDRGYKIIKE